MALDFSGTNQNARNTDGISGINVDLLTYFFWISTDAITGATDVIGQTAIEMGAGNFRAAFQVRPPTASGWQFQFGYNWDTTDGSWRCDSDDLALSTWMSILIKYDRSATANDPDIYVDGIQLVENELGTPAGSALTGEDSITLGENVGGGGDYDGRLAEFAIWTGDKSALAPSLAKGYSPAFFPADLKVYWPMIRDGQERMQNAALTLTGATAAVHPPIIYPAAPLVITAPAVAVVQPNPIISKDGIHSQVFGGQVITG